MCVWLLFTWLSINGDIFNYSSNISYISTICPLILWLKQFIRTTMLDHIVPSWFRTSVSKMVSGDQFGQHTAQISTQSRTFVQRLRSLLLLDIRELSRTSGDLLWLHGKGSSHLISADDFMMGFLDVFGAR